MKKWIISSMECKPIDGDFENVVIVIHWRRQSSEIINDKEYFADVYGAYSCQSPSGDFTPYPDLTKEQVESWLDNGLDVVSLDTTLDNQIENQVNPPILILPLPWNNANETPID